MFSEATSGVNGNCQHRYMLITEARFNRLDECCCWINSERKIYTTV